MCVPSASNEIQQPQALQYSMPNIVQRSLEIQPNGVVYSPASMIVLIAALLGGRGPWEDTNKEIVRGYKSMVGIDSGSTSEDKVIEHAMNYGRRMMNKVEVNQNCDVNSEAESVLCISNMMFIQDRFQVRDYFKTVLVNTYKFKVDKVDFSDSQTTAMINDRVSKATKQRIPKLLDEDLEADTRIFMANAIYFNATWANKMISKEGKFKPDVNSPEIDVRMLSSVERVPFKRDESKKLKVLSKPLKDTRYKMLFILPLERFGNLDDTLVTSEHYLELAEGMQDEILDFMVPEFKIETDLNMIPIFKKLGIKKAFTPRADFRGIGKNLYITKAIQKANIEVTKYGLAASAGTGMAMGFRSLSPRFRCDEPFHFALIDSTRKIVLFSGKYQRPN